MRNIDLEQCLLIFFIFGTFHVNSEICNPFKCFSFITELFQSSDEDACMNIKKIEKCVMDCSFGYDNNFTKKIFSKLRTDICFGDSFVKDINYECFFSDHKVHLLVCLYDKFSQGKIAFDSAQKLFQCKQVSDAQQCFKNIEMNCTHYARKDMETLLADLLSPWRDEYCNFVSYSEIENYPTEPLHNISDYYKLGKCLDEKSKLLTSCINEKWTFSNAVVNKKISKELCVSAETFVNCIQEKVLVECADVHAAFHHMEYLFYKHVFPFCLKSLKGMPEVAAEIFSTPTPDRSFNNSMATTEHVGNYTSEEGSQEMVHVHQHVIIEHRYYNSAFKLCSDNEIILFAILLIMFKNSI